MLNPFRSKTPLQRLSAMPVNKLQRYVSEIDYDLEERERAIDRQEARLQDMVKEGVGAPHLKKVRLAEKCAAKSMEINHLNHAYFQHVKLYSITRTLLALRETGDVVSGAHLTRLQQMFGVSSSEQLREMFRELHLESEGKEAPLTDIYDMLKEHSDREMPNHRAQNEYVSMMEELEAIKDTTDLDSEVRARISSKLNTRESEKIAA